MPQTQEVLTPGRMLTSKDVMAMLNVSNVWLWRHSNTKSDAHRIPSYKLGGKRMYKYEEIIHYLDNHKTTPNKK